MVANHERMMHFAMIDTIVYGEERARALSNLPHELVVD